jgi:Lon protease-like protein
MEMVRKIQKSFYGQQQDNDDAADSSRVAERTTTMAVSPSCKTLLKNVPLWRTQWVEMPGYQNLLNVHVAHYTHMFHTILAGPKPWYFGHVFLPGGSENLDNPDYRLVPRHHHNGPPSNNNNTTKATYTGVLMQICDAQQLEDGRLALVVQALERFHILHATQHTPYAIATVQLLPDTELVMSHYQDALDLAQELGDDFLNDRDAWGAACAAALETAEQLRVFEYRPVTVGSSTMGAVAPLANFDMEINVETIFPSVQTLVTEQCDKVRSVMEQHLLSASPMELPDSLQELEAKQVMQLEHEVWLGVDELVRLLQLLNPNANAASVTPVPTQMLGLLPRPTCLRSDFYIPWPSDFKLDQYADRLEQYAASMAIGTYSKSPFVRYDYADSLLKRYPALRRAQRLSYVVWILIGNIGELPGDADSGSKPPSRQEILEMPSISARLKAAKDRLDAINDTLRLIANQG